MLVYQRVIIPSWTSWTVPLGFFLGGTASRCDLPTCENFQLLRRGLRRTTIHLQGEQGQGTASPHRLRWFSPWLVVYLPLWKIGKSVGIILPNIWKVIKNVPNHQPVPLVFGCFWWGLRAFLLAKLPIFRLNSEVSSWLFPAKWIEEMGMDPFQFWPLKKREIEDRLHQICGDPASRQIDLGKNKRDDLQRKPVVIQFVVECCFKKSLNPSKLTICKRSQTVSNLYWMAVKAKAI